MAQISKGRTVLIIAHRLSTVRPAHQIYVVEKGEIVEHCSHEKLLRVKRFYARLYRHQDGAQRSSGTGTVFGGASPQLVAALPGTRRVLARQSWAGENLGCVSNLQEDMKREETW